MYKDPDRQREADRARQKRRRDKIRAEGVTKQSVTSQGVTVALYQHPDDVSKPKQSNTSPMLDELGAEGIRKQEFEDKLDLIKTLAMKDAGTKLIVKPKRGKDIKCFGDLPMDVQASIDRLSVVDGKIDQTIKANRAAIAVNYQHQFPDRFHSTGVA